MDSFIFNGCIHWNSLLRSKKKIKKTSKTSSSYLITWNSIHCNWSTCFLNHQIQFNRKITTLFLSINQIKKYYSQYSLFFLFSNYLFAFQIQFNSHWAWLQSKLRWSFAVFGSTWNVWSWKKKNKTKNQKKIKKRLIRHFWGRRCDCDHELDHSKKIKTAFFDFRTPKTIKKKNQKEKKRSLFFFETTPLQ